MGRKNGDVHRCMYSVKCPPRGDVLRKKKEHVHLDLLCAQGIIVNSVRVNRKVSNVEENYRRITTTYSSF